MNKRIGEKRATRGAVRADLYYSIGIVYFMTHELFL